MFRPKNCKKCGGKMSAQAGRIMMPQLPAITDADYLPVQEEEEKKKEYDRIQQGILAGIIEPPRADSPDEQMTAQQYYDRVNSIPVSNVQYKNNMTPQKIGMFSRGLRTVASEIGNVVERGRQNDWDAYQQPSHIMNPMPTDDYQPNPYSLYAKYGGKLKNYQQGGPKPINPTNPLQGYNNSMAVSAANQPKPSYHFPAYNYDVSSSGRSEYERLFNNAVADPDYFEKTQVTPAWGSYASSTSTRPQNIQEQRMQYALLRENILQDARGQKYKGAAKALSVTPEVSVNPNRQQGGMMAPVMANRLRNKYTLDGVKQEMYQVPVQPLSPQEKTSYSVSSVNPQGKPTTQYFQNLRDWEEFMKDKQYITQSIAGDKSSAQATAYLPPALRYGGLKHAKYFGPPFSNGATFKFAPSDRIDHRASKRVISKMLKDWMGYRKGGIHIKPENKGKFTDYCGGKVTEECIEKGKDSPSATIRKRATFAQNARKWN